MRKRKKTLVFGIVLLLLFLGIGYAYLTTTLSINGTTDIDSNVWDVYFDNVNVTTGSVTGEQEIEAPTITSDTTVEYHIRLKEPGEFYEFTIDAKNDGTIDAMIETITKKVNGGTTIPAYLNYTVTYSDDIEIEDNHLLEAESLETYKVRVEYRSDIDPSDLPSTAQSLTLSFGVSYVQSDSNGKEAGHILTRYTISDIEMTEGSPVPDGVTLYKTPEEARAAFSNRPFYLKHTIQNGVILDSFVEFVITDEMVSLHPEVTSGTYTIGESSTDLNDTIVTLTNAFGWSNCDIASNTYCSISRIYAGGNYLGKVYSGFSGVICSIDSNGTSSCYYDPEG